jgi:RimJ/RimL family protein N-acetyltransferase
MLNPMSKVLIVSSALIAASFIGAGPASAASTRAEYIAQADPICQQFVGPEQAAATSYHRNYKRWARDFTKGSFKGWVNQTKRLAASLRLWNQVHATMTEQVAAVQPVPADAGLISTWLDGRRRSDGYANAAASALNRFQFERYDRLARQADNAEAAGLQAITGFGFTVCGVYA